MMSGKVVVVMVGGTLIVIDNACSSSPSTLVALTVKLNVPPAVGVPEIPPSVESVNPVGRSPDTLVHVIGVVPVAVKVSL